MTKPTLPWRLTLGTLGFAASLLLAQKPVEQAFSASEVEGLLPADQVTVDVMELKPPARLAELTKQLQEAAKANPQWWLRMVKKAKPGEPLPYDPKMGLTKEEYAEFLRLGNEMVLNKARTATLRLTRKEDRLTFEGGKDLPELNGVELDLKMNSVRTPFGIADQRSRITASDSQKATGPWDGIQWRLEKPDLQPDSLTTAKFALGRQKSNGRGILYYDVRQVGGAKRRVSYFLYYDLNPRK
jgi:hypothetical protein